MLIYSVSLKSEFFRNLGQKLVLARQKLSVSDRDVEQPIHDIGEEMPILMEQTVELPSVHLESADILFCKVEDAGDVVLFAFRNFENFFEGVDFVFRHNAIGLRHFRPERNDTDREGDLLVVIGVRTDPTIDGEVPREPPISAPIGPPTASPRGRAGQFPPDGHVICPASEPTKLCQQFI